MTASKAAKPAGSRPGKPAAHPKLKLLNGRTPETDSGGRKVDPEIPFDRGAPKMPSGMSPDAEWMWEQVVSQLETVGLLKPLDAMALEMACETFARWREAVNMRQEDGLLASNSQGRVSAPWVGIEERASKEFRGWCAEFGFTPASEKNLPGGEDGSHDENPF